MLYVMLIGPLPNMGSVHKVVSTQYIIIVLLPTIGSNASDFQSEPSMGGWIIHSA